MFICGTAVYLMYLLVGSIVKKIILIVMIMGLEIVNIPIKYVEDFIDSVLRAEIIHLSG